MASPDTFDDLSASLIEWYGFYGRDLPWRHTRDPYSILIAEVMLQQTQVSRVVPKYGEFIAAFPNFEALARASLGDVIRVWAPLGYNSRAVRLQRLAQRVVTEYGGFLPNSIEVLQTMPGIGTYTAAAVACFAFGTNVPVFDTNVYRVLSRVSYGLRPPARRDIEGRARALLPSGRASAWNQALMDVGATLCTAARTHCSHCPLQQSCKAAPYLHSGASRELILSTVPSRPRQSQFHHSLRYYRGRIVEVLRGVPQGQRLAATDLGKMIHPGFDPVQDMPWLYWILGGLAKDNLLHLAEGPGGSLSAALPDTSAN